MSLDPDARTWCPSCDDYTSTSVEMEAGGTVCTQCGYLLSTSTSFETLGRANEDGFEAGRTFLHDGGLGYAGGKAGSRVRGVGQPEAYHENRQRELEIYMRKILERFRLSSLNERAKHLFYTARKQEHFDWGIKADLMAAACMYVAAAESKRHLIPELVAKALSIDPRQLQSAGTTVKVQNGLANLVLVTPHVYLPCIIAHLKDLVKSKSPKLSGHKTKTAWSPETLTFLRKLNLNDVVELATLAIDLGERVHLTANRNAPQVATGAVLLAMEGSMRKFPPLSADIIAELAYSVGHVEGAFTGRERYREFCKLLTDLADQCAWIDKPFKKKEFSQNIDSILRVSASLTPQTVVAVPPAPDGPVAGTSRQASIEVPSAPSQGKRARAEVDSDDAAAIGNVVQPMIPPKATKGRKARPAKYMRTNLIQDKRALTIESAADSLLAFLPGHQPSSSTPTSSLSSTVAPTGLPSASGTASSHSLNRSLPFAAHTPESVAARQRLLAGETPSSIILEPRPEYDPYAPSRLRRLLIHRGREDLITDEELFAEDELESLIRGEDEARQLLQTEAWQPIIAYEPPTQADVDKRRGSKSGKPRKQRRKRGGTAGADSARGESPPDEFQVGSGRKTKVDAAMRAAMRSLGASLGGDLEDEMSLEMGMEVAEEEEDEG